MRREMRWEMKVGGIMLFPVVNRGERHIRIIQSSDEDWKDADLAKSENVAAATRKDQKYFGDYPVAVAIQVRAAIYPHELQTINWGFGRVAYVHFGVIDLDGHRVG